MKNSMDNRQIREMVQSAQSEKRFEHTLGVAYTATALAMKYDVDLKKAYLAGLLHDCAKCLPHEEMLRICLENEIAVSDLEKRNPFLLHGKAGSFLAKSQYGITDEDILNAVSYHTTGRPGMSLLEKIIFTADYIEPGRDKAQHLVQIRKLAFEDIDAAVLWILKDTLEYLKSSDGEIDPGTEMTCAYFSSLSETRGTH